VTLDRAIFRGGPAILFGIYAVSALLAFWPSYLSNPLAAPTAHWHFHGLANALWLTLLVTQTLLIRGNNRDLHRRLGKISFLAAPALAVSIVFIAHYRLVQDPEPTLQNLTVLGTGLGSALLFSLTYLLAIHFRREPKIHARYMICTVLPMTGPIFDRILMFYVFPVVDFIPRFSDGEPFPPYLSLPAIDLVLAGLALWDWLAHRRLSVFPVVLAVFVAVQLLAFGQADTDYWRSFAQWFLEAPIP